MDFFTRLEQRSAKINSLLCVGLDPRHAIKPGAEPAECVTGMIEENKRIIEATVDVTLAYKPNIAFYEALGAPGIQALEVTLGFIPDDVPVILDAKRGDIGATALGYEKACYDHLGADAVTVAPYMGMDSAEPLFSREGKGIFVLCKTSNPGSSDFQLIEDAEGTTLYRRVADTAVSWGDNIGLVVAGNDPAALRDIRSRHPDVWFLSPGIGAQGGSMEEAISAGINSRGTGILPVVARGISQAEDPGQAARDFVAELNLVRDKAMAGKSTEAVESDPLKERILEGLLDTNCFKVGDFVLKSGEHSPFYIDLRRVMSFPSLMKDVARAYARLIRDLKNEGVTFASIAGIPVAGLPLATAVSLETGIPMIFPRMTQKAHGTGVTVEGEWKEGDRVLLLDDLITHGKSKLEALEILAQAGLVVEHLVVLIERGVSGRKDMDAAGVDLRSFAHLHEFLPLCERRGTIDASQRAEMEEFAKH